MRPLACAFDLVCANLPYVAAGTPLPAEVTAQPAGALYAGDGGAALIDRFLGEAAARLAPGGRVLAELDPSIVEAVSQSAGRNYTGHKVHRDVDGRERVLEAWSILPTNPERSA
jgi:release factor glutamine methyltransferase